MRAKIYNEKILETIVSDIKCLLDNNKEVNIMYEPASKDKTKKQVGFFYGALCSQICDYLKECGFSVNIERVKRGLYKQVSVIVPELVVDDIFGDGEYILHISDINDRALMSKFIDGVFQVIDSNPMYYGLKLTPDVRYNWVKHLDDEDIKFAQTQELKRLDNDYLNHIRDLPCIICGKQHRSDVHHLKDNRLCGISEKAPDWATIPLCHECHLGIAHNTGFEKQLRWMPIDLIDFTRLCYLRWRNLKN